MTEVTTATLRIASWVEDTTEELTGGGRVSQAQVALGDDADGADRGAFASLLYYREDGTSAFVSILRLTMSLGGRQGSFVALGDGAYDGSSAVVRAGIAPDSGTGDLTGITGTVTSRSEASDYPFMPLTIEYELPQTAQRPL